MKKWSMALAVAALLAGAQADAQPVSVDVVYDVSLLGLSVGTMRLQLEIEGDAYAAKAYVQPEGLAATFAPNIINAQTSGHIAGGRALPDQSWVQQTKSDRVRIVQMSYRGGTPVSVSVEPAYKASPYAPSEADRQGTVDAISALVSTLLMPTVATADAPCGTTIPVYDGRRRYDFALWSGGSTQVEKGAGGYRGAALYCVGTYRRVAGWRPDRISEEYDTKIHGYYAPIAAGPGGTTAFYLPVRLWGESEVGDVVAIPASVTINGQPWQDFFNGG